MRILTGTLFALCLAFPAHAESDREARLAVARDYVEATMSDTDVQEFIRQLWQPMVQQMAATRQPLEPEQIAEIESLFSTQLTQPITDVMLRQDAIMADIMTLEELTALRDFYTSEHGGAVMRKMPQLAQLQQPMISAVLQKAMPEMMPKIEEITTRETD
ncbi:DUF2059 domain-containing protein [uncultured Roseovarius sp.]|uniref:DUF2059 domain-containing protein n=1 Tax=uncultured Roseovarius sp. TaxID=293344 RepID=UPI002634CBCC|nr:DUF2059 domain-containing protein [uncultured Roseovarius sp.]